MGTLPNMETLVVLGDSSWVLVLVGASLWSLLVIYGTIFWRILVNLGGSLWFLVFFMVLGW